MNRTLIAEIIGGLFIVTLGGLVGNLWDQVDQNKSHIIEITGEIAAQGAAGDAEILRSTAIDDEQKEKIKDNYNVLNVQEDGINANKTSIAVLYERTGQHAKKGREEHHREGIDK